MAKATKKEMTAAPREGELQRARMSRPWDLLDEMERMMESSFPFGPLRPFRWGSVPWRETPAAFAERAPCVDLIDRDNEIVVRAELPGVDKKDLDVSVTDNSVTIKGKTNHEEKEETGDYYRCERVQGSFARTMTLPVAVEGAKAKAEFADGLLELHLPKLAAGKRRRIKIE